jgi:hypothetical protein
MNYFLDTEFIESGSGFPIELLSIGLVSEDGREYYAINANADFAHANEWVQKNVVPDIRRGWATFSSGRDRVRHFVGSDPEPRFWGYYADYDWVVFCQLFGAMIDLPKGWPMYCRDLKQLLDDRGNPSMPKPVGEHNALNDARWNRDVYVLLTEQSHA